MRLVGVDLQWGRDGVSSHLCPGAIGGYTFLPGHLCALVPCDWPWWEAGAWHDAGIRSVCLSAFMMVRRIVAMGSLHCIWSGAVPPEMSSGRFLFDSFLTSPTSSQTSETSTKKKKKKKKQKEVEESSE